MQADDQKKAYSQHPIINNNNSQLLAKFTSISLLRTRMRNNKLVDNHYINHIQNDSPAKTTYSFSKGERFLKISSPTPNKFYEKLPARSERATSLGYGKKTSLILKQMGDPGWYDRKGEFEMLKQKMKSTLVSTFGQSHENIMDRSICATITPGPGQYEPEEPKTRSRFYMGKKLTDLSSNSTKAIGPQSYHVDIKALQKTSRYKNVKGFRIKTQIPASQTKLQLLCQPYRRSPGPGAYNPQSIVSIESCSRSSFLKGTTSLPREQRLRAPIVRPNLGPGSYPSFSIFGSQI